MQDQGKRLLLAVALALGVMMIWQVIFPSKKAPPKPPQTAGSGSAVVTPENQDPFYNDKPPVVGDGSGAAGSGSSAEAPPVTAPPVALEGYGVRLELVPPFRLDRSRGPKSRKDEMAVVHQDAPDKTRSLSIVPVAVAGDVVPPLQPVAKPRAGYRVGDKGTLILLAPGMIDAQGVAVIGSGPGAGGWTLVSGPTERQPWVDGMTCASSATAAGYTCTPEPSNPGQENPPPPIAVGSGSAAGSGSDAGSGAVAGSGSGAGSGAAPVAVAPPVPAPPPEVARGPEVTKTFTFEKIKVVTTNWGGAIKQWKLLAPKYERDHYKGEMVPAVGDGGMLAYFVVGNAPGEPTSTYRIPREAVWEPSAETDTSITYTWTSPELVVTKTFTIMPDDFLLDTKIEIAPTDKTVNAQQTLAVRMPGYQDPKASTKHARGDTEWKAACLRGDVRVASWRSLAQQRAMENGVHWAGFANGYRPGSRFSAAQAGQFLVATAPRQNGNELIACNAYAVQATPGLMQVDLQFQPAQIKAGDPPVSRELVSYLGPSSYALLENADAKAGYSTGFKEVPDFGWFGVIGRPLLWLLHKLYDVVGNWGLAIMLLTMLVKASTIYFTTRSMRSMKAMAALTPKMKELQEKHKDDRAKLQQETMGMYKQYGVNPLAGCLPILLQMPIWIALYRMLSAAGELYLEPLIPGWISDLTSPDPYHVLPIILITTMFLQAKLQPQTQTGFQQKLIMYGLPLMFGVASFFFPSGLSLYIVTNTLLSAFHSVYMNKWDKKGKAIVAAIQKQAGTGPGGTGGSGGGSGGGGGGGGKASGKAEGKADDTKRPKAAAKPAIEVEDRSAKAKAAKLAEASVDPADADADADDDGDPDADADADDRQDDDDDDADGGRADGGRATAASASGDAGDDGGDADEESSAGGEATQSAAQRSRRASRARRKRRGRKRGFREES